MTAVSGKLLPTGLRHASIFELNDYGSPAASGATAYEGLQIVGGKAFELNIPDARRINHTGDDGPLAVDFLPPTESATGELRAARNDYDIYALLSGTKAFTVGEAKGIGIVTDQMGYEPQVGLHLFQQALDEAGVRHWRSFVMPRAVIYAHPMGMQPNEAEHRFLVAPMIVSSHLWETEFALAEEGFTRSQICEFMTRYKPKLIAFKAAMATVEFPFPVTAPAADILKVVVWVDGVLTSAGITVTTDKVTFQVAPGANKRVVIFYETK